jgi:hypothetical protein
MVFMLIPILGVKKYWDLAEETLHPSNGAYTWQQSAHCAV